MKYWEAIRNIHIHYLTNFVLHKLHLIIRELAIKNNYIIFYYAIATCIVQDIHILMGMYV